MKITMREAIENGDIFKLNGYEFYLKDDVLVSKKGTPMSAHFILANCERFVEVEDNYWDKDGRAIRELEIDAKVYSVGETKVFSWDYEDEIGKDIFLLGNCFKDKESAEAELQRLKDLQKSRMEANNE